MFNEKWFLSNGSSYNLGEILHELRAHGNRSLVGGLHRQLASEYGHVVVAFLFHPALQTLLQFFDIVDAILVQATDHLHGIRAGYGKSDNTTKYRTESFYYRRKE